MGIAGTTETYISNNHSGSIDPLNSIAEICRRYSIHFHVDAAWGGPLIFSPDYKHKLSGISLADSITVDGHKQLYTPLGLGILLLKSPTLAYAIRKTANYVIRATSPDLGKFTLEGSRPAHALYLHASLSLLGSDGLSVLTTRSCTLVSQLHVRISTHPSWCFQALHEPQSNILLYRYIPCKLRSLICDEGYVPSLEQSNIINEFTILIQKRQATTECFVSRTKVLFRDVLVDAFRVVVANPLTQWSDIEACLLSQIEIGALIEQEMGDEEERRSIVGVYADMECWWPGYPFDV